MDKFPDEAAAIAAGYTVADGSRLIFKDGDFAVWLTDRSERGSSVKTFAVSLWTGSAWVDLEKTRPVRLRDGSLVPMFPPGVYKAANQKAMLAIVAGR